MIEEFNILIGGVGGQGILLVSRILAAAAKESGLKVISGETHGLAQRMGSISVHLRFGAEVYGPLVPWGRADLILGLEPVETLRHVEYLSKEGVL